MLDCERDRRKVSLSRMSFSPSDQIPTIARMCMGLGWWLALTNKKTNTPRRREKQFWDSKKRSEERSDVKYARYLPGGIPVFVLCPLALFEREIAGFCFTGAHGRVLDAGCGNGNILIRALALDWPTIDAIDYVKKYDSSNIQGLEV